MEMSTELKIVLGVVLFIACLSLFYMFLLKFILPRIAMLFEKFHDSYKHCIKFIKSNEKIEKKLGRVMKIQSLPVPQPIRVYAKYRFQLVGHSRTGILYITMHWGRESDIEEWLFDTADLEMEGEVIDLRASHMRHEK